LAPLLQPKAAAGRGAVVLDQDMQDSTEEKATAQAPRLMLRIWKFSLPHSHQRQHFTLKSKHVYSRGFS